jgi:peptidoglycan/xylan/chitin deacetylase (PgdA/CDA1 family)
MKIRIDVPCYNRKKITEVCLRQLKDLKSNYDIWTFNDYSTDYDNNWLSRWADITYQFEGKSNIHHIRSHAYKLFLDSDYDFLYMTDNDAYHDPNFMTELLNCYNTTGLPATCFISGYLTQNFSWYKAKQVTDTVSVMNNACGGISMFLHRSHVETIVKKLNGKLFEDMWDCYTWNMLGNKYAITNKSYVEHFGADGMHHKDFERERAVNPTDYLIEKRDIIIECVKS